MDKRPTNKNNSIDHTGNKNNSTKKKNNKIGDYLLNYQMNSEKFTSSNYENFQTNMETDQTIIDKKVVQNASLFTKKTDAFKKTEDAGRKFEQKFQEIFSVLNSGNLNLFNIKINMRMETHVINDIDYFGCFPEKFISIDNESVSFYGTKAFLGKMVYTNNKTITEIKEGTVFEFKSNIGTYREQTASLISCVKDIVKTKGTIKNLKEFLKQNYCPLNQEKNQTYSIADEMLSQIDFSDLTIHKLINLIRQNNLDEFRAIFDKFFIYSNMFIIIKKSSLSCRVAHKHIIINSEQINNFVLLFNGIDPDTVEGALSLFGNFFKEVMKPYTNIMAIYCRKEDYEKMNLNIIKVLISKERENQDKINLLIKEMDEKHEKNMQEKDEKHEKNMELMREEHEKNMQLMREEFVSTMQTFMTANSELRAELNQLRDEFNRKNN